MRVIDFVSLGAEDMVYIISQKGTSVLWQGTRQDFIRELSAFFLLFHRIVTGFDVKCDDVIVLHV